MLPNWISKLDLVDIGTHALGAVGVMFIGVVLGFEPILVAAVNAAGWFIREAAQRWRAGRTLNPLDWGVNKHAEWVVPAAVGFLLVIYGAVA